MARAAMRLPWHVEAATHLAEALRIYEEHDDELAGTPINTARAMLTALSKPARQVAS